jgi:hypothetical protein
MRRLYIELPGPVAEALQRSALSELRPTRLQGLALIREGLQRRGVLPADRERAAAARRTDEHEVVA